MCGAQYLAQYVMAAIGVKPGDVARRAGVHKPTMPAGRRSGNRDRDSGASRAADQIRPGNLMMKLLRLGIFTLGRVCAFIGSSDGMMALPANR